MDDLISEIKDLICGVYMEDEIISILLYADDIALVATNEVDLQKMLDKLSEWCLHLKLIVNGDKTQIVHFRKGPSVPKTDFNFKCGDTDLTTVDKYRYLGLIFTEVLDMIIMSKAVSLNATRALGLIIAKYKTHGGVP